MKKADFERMLITELGAWLSPEGYSFVKDLSEFQAETPAGLDRIYCNLYQPVKNYSVAVAVYKYFKEVENFWTLYGSILGYARQDVTTERTLFFNPVKIKNKEFDLFSQGPHYGFDVELSETGCHELIQKLKTDFEQFVFPVLKQYNNIEALDSVLHDDIDRLAADPLQYYISKAWLFNYDMLMLKSLLIAKLANNPAQERIYEINKKYILPFIDAGEPMGEKMLTVLEKIHAS